MRKFYCLECRHTLKRSQVHMGREEYDTKLYCNIHFCAVVKMDKVNTQRIIEDIETIVAYDEKNNTNLLEEFM